MKEVKILWIFYRKLIIPTFLFSVMLAFALGVFNPSTFGFSFLFILPLMQYFIYEVRFPDEYVFYANFGFSRKFLWIFTVGFAFFIKVLSGFL